MGLLRCFSSLGCPEMGLEEACALAAKYGLPTIELRSLGSTVDLAGYFAGAFGTPEKLASWLQGQSVRVVALNASLKLVGATEADKAQLVGLAPWAEAMGVRWLRVFDGGKTMDAAEIAQARATLDWWQGMRKQHGWRCEVMIETHDSLFTAEALQRFLSALPEATVLWDAHHTWRKGGEDPLLTWLAVRGRVAHVHVKDSVPVPSARHPFTYVLPGDGGFPVGPLLATLDREGFSGPVSLEWEKLWHPYLPSLGEALRVARDRSWW
ncbi:MAG: sugar phosphate isomerase/epimerase [Verrucomicrobiota bacterium]